MSKAGILGGGGQTPPFNPQGNGGMLSRGAGGILPEQGSQNQYDMVQALLQGSMQSAQASNSPLLAALMPIVGSAVASRTEGLRNQKQQESTDALLDLVGGGERTAAILEIMNDQNAPQSVRSAASSMFGKILNPPKGKKGSGRKRIKDSNGSWRYLDTGEQVFPNVTPQPKQGDYRQYNEATEILSGAISDLQTVGYSAEEAREMVTNDPMYAAQWGMLDGYSAPSQVPVNQPAPTVPVATPQPAQTQTEDPLGIRQ